MIMLALAMLASQPAPPAEVQRDIVVLGGKLNRWKATIRSTKGRVTCTTQISSGDADVDAIGCSAMSACIARFEQQLIASGDRKRPRVERKALNAAVAENIKTCTIKERDMLIAALAERRFAARQGY